MLNIPIGSQVDIHLVHGILARGEVTEVSERFIYLEKKPAIHCQHGISLFETIEIPKKAITTVGYRGKSKT